MVSAKALAPFNAALWSSDKPFKNGCTDIINNDSDVPIRGNADAAPAATPPTIPPIKLPMACPIVVNNGIAFATCSAPLSLSLSSPITPNPTPNTPTIATNTPAPLIAAAPNVPTAVNANATPLNVAKTAASCTPSDTISPRSSFFIRKKKPRSAPRTNVIVATPMIADLNDFIFDNAMHNTDTAPITAVNSTAAAMDCLIGSFAKINIAAANRPIITAMAPMVLTFTFFVY